MVIELVQVFVENIAPILLIAAIGFIAGRRLNVDADQLGRLLFNIFSPVLVFRALATSTISASEFGQLLLAMLILVAVMALLSFGVAAYQKQDRVQRAGSMLSAIWPNSGNLGLPLAQFAFGDAVFSRAVIVYVAITIINYTVGVYIASSGKSTPRQTVRKLFKIPVVYMVIAGTIINLMHITLPVPIERSVTLLSQATIPLMLILLGVQLAQSERVQQPQLVFSAVGLRLLISPVIAAVLGIILALNGVGLVAFILQASMPVAVASIIFANEFKLNREQILSTVLVSTVLSPLTLSVLILILQQASHLHGK